MASSLKVLPVRGPQPANVQEARKRKATIDEAKVKAQVTTQRAGDPISAPINWSEFIADVVPTQIWGQQLINDFNGPGPKYRFKRWYLGIKIIVDTFLTQAEYDAADVDGRRSLLKKYGYRYAALGPMHSVLPHENKELRAKYPSQMEQLGLA